MIDNDTLQQRLNQVALRFITYRDRLEGEIIKRLKLEVKKKQYGEEGEKMIPVVVEKIREMGLIDDVQFIKDFTRIQLESKFKGPYFISRRLFQLGADSSLVKSLMVELIDGEKEGVAIDQVIQRKFPQGINDQKDKIRLYNQLKSRGFSHQSIKEKIDASVTNRVQ